MRDDKTHTTCAAEVFWGEIAPCRHVVQIYEGDEDFIQNLKIFVSQGFDNNEAVIVIASPEHLRELNLKLSASYDLANLQEGEVYFGLNAEEALGHFMLDGWPDEARFREFVSSLILMGRKNGRKVRAFGEMVAILWAEGNRDATIQLEKLWHQLCELEVFPVFCAYPKAGFTQNANDSIRNICNAHNYLINSNLNSGEISYSKLSNYGAAV